LVRLREDPARAQALGERGRAFVVAHFDRNALVAALEERIDALLGGKALPQTAELRAPEGVL
jgi:hypothetical protein